MTKYVVQRILGNQQVNHISSRYLLIEGYCLVAVVMISRSNSKAYNIPLCLRISDVFFARKVDSKANIISDVSHEKLILECLRQKGRWLEWRGIFISFSWFNIQNSAKIDILCGILCSSLYLYSCNFSLFSACVGDVRIVWLSSSVSQKGCAIVRWYLATLGNVREMVAPFTSL